MVRLITSNTRTFPFDPKGDTRLHEVLLFHVNGQVAYGEWFKRLNAKDKPPRGACSVFFAIHIHCRSDEALPRKLTRRDRYARTRMVIACNPKMK